MGNWLKGLFGGGSSAKPPKTVKDAARDDGVYEGAIRHKDGRKIRNDAHLDNLKKNVEKRRK